MYKRLNIGTGKPSREEQDAVRHHVIDLIEPGESYSAARFVADASAAVTDILSRGKEPLIVGGTGLYLRALIDGLLELDEPSVQIRESVAREIAQLGAEQAWEKLRTIDPLEAAKFHPNNTVRLARALELFYQTGKSKSELIASGYHIRSPHQYLIHALVPERAGLYAAIEQRVDLMIKAGWEEEIRQLIDRGFGPKVALANVIGYTELLGHLEGRIDRSEAIARIKQETRRYAKRQLTWLRHQFSQSESERAELLLEELRKQLSGGGWQVKT